MSSLIGALGSTLSGMKVAQQSIDVISANIANATNTDYTRKTIDTESITVQYGAGGVRVSGYTRAIDAALEKSYNASISQYAGLSTQDKYMTSVKDLYGISGDTTQLDTLVSNFNNAWQSYSASPESVANQTQVVAAGKALTNEIQRLSAGVEAIDRQVKQETQDDVDKVNGLLNDIADLNKKVSQAVTSNTDAGSLQDQRDAKVRELSQYMAVNSYDGANGTIRLTTAQGSTLLDVLPVKISYNGTDLTDSSGNVISDQLSGGSLQSLINFRADNSPAAVSSDPGTEVLRKLREQLDSLVTGFTSATGTPTTFAAAYNNATTGTGELAASFFTGTDRTNIAVNVNLTNGTNTLKQASGAAVYASLIDSSRSFTAGGINMTGATYSSYVSQMFTSIGQASAMVTNGLNIASSTQDAYKERVSGVSGVNTDQELVNLTQIQNSYAVSAHVVTILSDMLDTLTNIIR